MVDYDFDVPLPTDTKRKGRSAVIRQMPKGASCFFPSQHKNNTVSATTSAVRREHKMKLVCKRVTEKGVEGFRVWHLKDGEQA